MKMKASEFKTIACIPWIFYLNSFLFVTSFTITWFLFDAVCVNRIGLSECGCRTFLSMFEIEKKHKMITKRELDYGGMQVVSCHNLNSRNNILCRLLGLLCHDSSAVAYKKWTVLPIGWRHRPQRWIRWIQRSSTCN